MQSILNAVINLFYNNTCCACSNELVQTEKTVCSSCMSSLAPTNFYSQPTTPIHTIFKGRVPIQHTIAMYYFNKNTAIQSLLFALKYRNKKEIAHILGLQFGLALYKTTWIQDIDYIIPIPLSKAKEHKRGYNQSELIAQAIEEVINKPILSNEIQRVIDTETQTHKTRSERVDNMRNAFDVTDVHTLQHKHILLLDDVITTGATIESCIIALLEKIPSVKISVATLCYTIE